MQMLYFLAMSFSMMILSCGSHQVWGGKDKDTTSQTMLPQRFGTPVPMQLADPECQRLGGSSPLGDREVLRFDGEQVTSKPISFSGESTTLGLTSRGLASTLYGEEKQQRLQIVMGSTTYDYRESVSIISQGSYLKLCGDGVGSGTDKIENAALSALSVVEEGFKSSILQNNSHHGAAPANSALQLSLMPLLEMTYEQTDAGGQSFSMAYHATDNAVWSLNQVDDQVKSRLTLYPQSQEARDQGLFGSIPLYYVPFVVAHELGHEFFYRLMPAYFQSLSAAESSLYWGESRSQWHQVSFPERALNLQSPSLSQNALTNAEVMVALSEGFADMFAYYLLPDSERDLSALNCLQHRDPRLKRFSSSVEKILNADVLEAYLNKQAEAHGDLDQDERCGKISFADPHLLGAILSHHFVTLLDQRQSPAESMKLLGAWLQRLNQSLSNQYFDLGPRQLMAKAIYDFLRELEERQAFSPHECQSIETNFSVLNQGWDLGC